MQNNLSENKLSRLLYDAYYHHSEHPTNNVLYDSKQAARYVLSDHVVLPKEVWNALLPGNKLRYEIDRLHALNMHNQLHYEELLESSAKELTDFKQEYVDGALSALYQEREANEELRAELDDYRKGVTQESNAALEYTNHELAAYVKDLESALLAAQRLIDSFKEYQDAVEESDKLRNRSPQLNERRSNYERSIKIENQSYFGAYLKVQQRMYAESDYYEEALIDEYD